MALKFHRRFVVALPLVIRAVLQLVLTPIVTRLTFAAPVPPILRGGSSSLSEASSGSVSLPYLDSAPLLHAAASHSEGLTSSSKSTGSGCVPSKPDASLLELLPRPVLFLLAATCLGLAAIVAGLTLGMMSLDMVGLEIVMSASSSASDAEAARCIKPIRARGNLLLVTLLLTNTIAMEVLPLILETLYPGGMFALIVSVLSILLFSEILPQAVFSRHALQIGAFFVPFVRVLMTLLYPIAFPIALTLDALLGAEAAKVYTHDELRTLMNVHSANVAGTLGHDALDSKRSDGTHGKDSLDNEKSQGTAGSQLLGAPGSCEATLNENEPRVSEEHGEGGGAGGGHAHGGGARLTVDETQILQGALEMRRKTVRDVMTKVEEVYMLSVEDSVMDRETMREILKRGHSRVPLYQGTRDNVVALLLVKQLIELDPDEKTPIRSMVKRKKKAHKVRVAPPLYVDAKTPLAEMLNEFQLGRSHMGVVVDSLQKPRHERRVLGVVTLEDIMEEILQEEIYDETDELQPNSSALPGSQNFGAGSIAAAAGAAARTDLARLRSARGSAIGLAANQAKTVPVKITREDGSTAHTTLNPSALVASRRVGGTSSIVWREIDVDAVKRKILSELEFAPIGSPATANLAAPDVRVSAIRPRSSIQGQFSRTSLSGHLQKIVGRPGTAPGATGGRQDSTAVSESSPLL